MIASSFLFFSMGASFSILGKNPLPFLRRHPKAFIVVWLAVFLTDWSGHALFAVPFGLYVHRVSLVLNIFMLLLAGSWLHNRNYPGRALLDRSSFWIYTTHYPLTLVVTAVSERYLLHVSDIQLLAFYLVSVVTVTGICVAVYWLLQRFCPSVLSFTTGHRL